MTHIAIVEPLDDPGTVRSIMNEVLVGQTQYSYTYAQPPRKDTRKVQQRGNIRIAYLDLGEIRAQKKQYPEAIKAYVHAAELDPTQPDAHFRLGQMYQRTGQAEKSKAEFAKTRELHQKSDAAVVLQLGGPHSPP